MLVLWLWICPALILAAPPIVVMEPIGQLEGPAGNPMAQPTDVVVQTSGTIWALDGARMRLARFSPQFRFQGYVLLEKAEERPTTVPREQPVLPILPPPVEPPDEFLPPVRREFLPPLPEKKETVAAARAAKVKAPGQRPPVALGLDGADRLLVGDREKGTIQVFSAQGAPVATISIPRNGAESAPDPTDILAESPTGPFWVADNDNHCVKQLDEQGRLLRRIGKQGSAVGEMQYPATLARGRDGRLLVTDVLNARVDIFDGAGKPGGVIGSLGVTAGKFYRPKGIACDPADRIHVTDSFTGLVQTFDTGGRLIGVWGNAAGQPHRLRSPATICVDGANRFYVVEMLANCVTVWRER